MTETSAGICGNAGPDYVAKPDSCGPAYPVNEVAIVPEDFAGDEPSDDLPNGPDIVGELWIKGPNVIRGYWNKPEETSQCLFQGLATLWGYRENRRPGLHLHRRSQEGRYHSRW